MSRAMMTEDPSLEDLLRASAVTNGSINLTRVNGSDWRATISHTNGHMVHPFDDWKSDPVEALRIALIEDERLSRDLKRRYDAAPKLGYSADADDGAYPVIDDDFEGLLG